MVRLVDALVHGGGDDDDDDDGGGYYYFAFGWESEAKCPGPVNKERPKIWAEKTVDSLNYIGE
uniref:Uncharacterized protein n=1 Tax=Oryza barthii TaxID=65489 RepID=A0A0D3FFA4_9ORYZ